MQQPNTSGAFGVTGGLKINVEMDDGIISQLADSPGDNANDTTTGANNATIEKFSNRVTYYPNKPLNIPVTLEYSASTPDQKIDSVENNAIANTEVVPINEIDENGNMIQIGETTMTKTNNEEKKCDDTLCHPNMADWLKKPFPCSGCVPNETETWN